MKSKVRWAKAPIDKDYAAAQRYLSLVLGPNRAASLARALRKASLEHFVARDLMRAAGYDFSAPHDTEQRKEIKRGQKLAPLLIVRDVQLRRLIIADGYHRLGAACEIDDTAEAPCKIVSIEGRTP